MENEYEIEIRANILKEILKNYKEHNFILEELEEENTFRLVNTETWDTEEFTI